MDTVYLNGQFKPLKEALIPVTDRGFLFGDGIYEVMPVYNGKPFRLENHLERLEHGLAEIKIPKPLDKKQWQEIITNLITKNGSGDMIIYIQITRGDAGPRNHLFPEKTTPTVFLQCSNMTPFDIDTLRKKNTAITVKDLRWARCDIKSISLLANVLMRQAAKDAGVDESIVIRDGFAVEGAINNLFMVKNNVLITPPTTNNILPGVTRDLVLEMAEKLNIPVEQKPISQDFLFESDEIFLSSAGKRIVPITTLDNKTIGNGEPGPVWEKIIQGYADYKKELI